MACKGKFRLFLETLWIDWHRVAQRQTGLCGFVWYFLLLSENKENIKWFFVGFCVGLFLISCNMH
jgi:hypothetical protein